MGGRAKLGGLLMMLVWAVSTSSTAACDDGSAVKEPLEVQGPRRAPGVDAGVPAEADGGRRPDGQPGDCVQNPRTHEEIINGCTDAVKITKTPSLPLLSPDGGLHPLP